MPIKIVDAGMLEVGPIVVVIYGAPGLGKTSLAFTASRPLLFDFDGLAYKAGNRSGKQMVSCQDWKDIEHLVAADVEDYDTIIVDTVGTCLDKLIADIIRRNPKMGRGGVPTLQGYGQLKNRFRTWVNMVRSYGKDVVMIAQTSEEARGEDTVDRIYAVGASKQEVYQQATLMGRLSVRGHRRVLHFDPTDATLGKNCGLPSEIVVEAPGQNPTQLADLIDEARSKMDQRARRDQEEHARLADLRQSLQRLETPEDFNQQIAVMVKEEAPKADRHILLGVAEDKGLEFDKNSRVFKYPQSVTG